MARRPKEYKTTEQKIMDIVNEIQITEEHLTELKNQKKLLERDLEQEKIYARVTSTVIPSF